MKRNNLKRIFKGVVLSLVLCASFITFFSFPASAAVITEYYAEVTSSYINVREGPGLSYPVVTQYPKGFWFYAVAADYYEADGYRWYACPDGWIAQTGGLRFASREVSFDTLSLYDGYGELRWTHECSGTDNPNWGYHVDALEAGYRIRCDCGWWKQEYIYLSGGSVTGEGDIIFIGLDTDNDEVVDLRVGQSKFLPNRANSDLRPYSLLMCYDSAEKDTPTVTLHFSNKDYSKVVSYVFNWSVDVHVEDYGVVMVGNDGVKQIHYVDGDFLLYDRHMGVHLADKVRTYKTLETYKGNEEVVPAARHMEFVFILAPPGEGVHGDFEKIITGIREICGNIGDFFGNFGGFDSVFSDEDSPLNKLAADGLGAGVQEFFALVRNFFSALPAPLMNAVGAIFILSCLVGVFKLFL